MADRDREELLRLADSCEGASDALVKALIRSLGAKMLEAERHYTDDQPWTRPTLKEPDPI